VEAAEPGALLGAYLHGSAALGGFLPGRSDVDLLAVTRRPVDQPRLAAAIRSAATAGCPGTGLEMSVITAATARDLGGCPFELHLTTAPSDDKTVLGRGHPGDPDLVLHVAVCRQEGIAVAGPPPSRVFGAVPRRRVLTAMVDELRWGLDHAGEAYAVLNACRALRYLDDGILCSKQAAGTWARPRHPDRPVIARALARHRAGDDGPATPAAVGLVDLALGALDEGLAGTGGAPGGTGGAPGGTGGGPPGGPGRPERVTRTGSP
jgi:streptomycin 3"-adenylyltransferase